MPGFEMSVEIPSPYQDLAADGTLVRSHRLIVDLDVISTVVNMQSDVLVEVARVAEGPKAELAPKRFVSGVCSDVDFQSVLPGVHLTTIHAQMTFSRRSWGTRLLVIFARTVCFD